VSTLIRGAWVLAMAPGAELVRDGAVLVSDDGSITAVDGFEALASANTEAAVVGDGNGVVMPGLVNAHTHLTECLIPGMGETATLWEWFERVVDPAGRVITREEVRLGTRLKGAEMLRSGITTVNDMSCHRNLGSLASLGAAEGLQEMGLRGVVSFGAEDIYPDAPDAGVFMAEHEALADLAAGMELIGFRVGVGTVLGISPELFEQTVRASREHGWPVHTHLAEVREEVTASKLENGCSTIEHAGRAGLLDRPTIAGHCIWCSERDIGLMVDKQVAVAHNPVANMILASGVCPVPRLRREGLAVGLGTDGAASNDNQDMFGVLKSTGLLHKVSALRADAMTAIDVMRMATLEGARALGLDGEVGSLEPGKRADIVLLDGNTPELATIHDPWQQVVYCATARCVSDVWVDGVRRVEAGELADDDIEELSGLARQAGAELAVRAGLGGESVYAGPGTAGPFKG
jgi:5-methylthioadenosine/S-adenosylhomocysteine deaminase